MTRGAVAVFACNRSGSTVLFELLRRLSAATPERPTVPEFARAVKSWGACLSPHPDFLASGACRLGTTDYVAAMRDRFVFVAGVPVARHPGDAIHVSYSRPTDARLALVDGRTLFVPVRNPLDILVSHAFELEHVLPVMRGITRVSEQERDAYGRARLANAEWVAGAMTYVTNFYDAWLRHRDRFVSHRYEDLLREPERAIQRLADACGQSVSHDVARSLWNEVGHRPLKANPAHFFRPGTEKWREYLDDEHEALARAAGWTTLLPELGYEFPSAFSRRITPETAWNDRFREGLAVGDAMNHRMFGTPLVFSDASFVESVGSHAAVVTNDSDWLIQATRWVDEVRSQGVEV